jgi:hypothetical protein
MTVHQFTIKLHKIFVLTSRDLAFISIFQKSAIIWKYLPSLHSTESALLTIDSLCDLNPNTKTVNGSLTITSTLEKPDCDGCELKTTFSENQLLRIARRELTDNVHLRRAEVDCSRRAHTKRAYFSLSSAFISSFCWL